MQTRVHSVHDFIRGTSDLQRKTVIAIAHRPSRTLLTQGGLSARLWARQSGGFLGESTDG